MNRITPEDLQNYYEQSVLGMLSEDPWLKEFFAHPHLYNIMDGFSRIHAAYHACYPFMFMVARHLQPDFILELGTELGRGIISLHLG